ncbi:MAG TPA: hypothetical protein PLC80_19810 [Draconibacterium sp.]|nr:hypothetical protein [Draconibacterium sp.]
MNIQVLKILKIKLFEKRYLASRIACVIFILFLTSYIIGGGFSTIDHYVLVAIFIFLIQFLFQFSWVNFILGLLMFIVGAYFSLAVLSEFMEFPILNRDAYFLLVVGWSLCLTICVFAVFMIRGFLRSLN